MLVVLLLSGCASVGDMKTVKVIDAGNYHGATKIIGLSGQVFKYKIFTTSGSYSAWRDLMARKGSPLILKVKEDNTTVLCSKKDCIIARKLS